jgi:2-oxo-4-hydroxy-4-carboxy-5-ureidoimidazoline decarboxylase
MNVARLNALPVAEAQRELARCCGATRWVDGMCARRPFADAAAVYAAADAVWATMAETDWLEAFSRHPKIGDIGQLREKFAATSAWAASEQAGARAASEATLQRLQAGNAAYEAKFGFIFIVCATGKTAAEMAALLDGRLGNDRATELRRAAAEQAKITRIRLEKLP